MLEVQGLTVELGGRPVVRDVNLRAVSGEAVAIVGPNGAGKTSFARAMAGLLTYSSGTVTLNFGGEPRALDRMATWRRCREGLVYVPAERPVFEELSVRDNLEIVRATLDRRTARRCDVLGSMQLFPGLATRHSQAAGTLSGGERRMLAIARACLAAGAARGGTSGADLQGVVLILDEPTHGLAPRAIEILVQQIDRLKDVGASVIVFEQDPSFSQRIAQRVCEMNLGVLNVLKDRSSVPPAPLRS